MTSLGSIDPRIMIRASLSNRFTGEYRRLCNTAGPHRSLWYGLSNALSREAEFQDQSGKDLQAEPNSLSGLVQQIVDFADSSGLQILGVGYTIYLGSEHEGEMLRQAAQLVFEAHKAGLVTVLWIYPRGIAVKDEKDPHLIAGAAGVAATLGSDFVKVNYPEKAGHDSPQIFREAVQAAGRTKVVCAGGGAPMPKSFLQRLHDQIHISGAAGNATGRNIHQRPLEEAIRLCNAIYAITIEDYSVDAAL